MQRVLVSQLQEGMITARNIYSADGLMLLAADSEISAQYIRRLEELEIYAIYVRTPFCEDIEIPTLLDEETRLQSIRTVKRGFDILREKRGPVNLEEIRAYSWTIVSEILRNRQAMIHLTEIRTHDDYTFSHSVNALTKSSVKLSG